MKQTVEKNQLEIYNTVETSKETEFPYDIDIFFSSIEGVFKINTRSKNLREIEELKGARSINLADNKLIFGCKNTIRVYTLDNFKEIFEVPVIHLEDYFSKEEKGWGLNSVELVSIDQKNHLLYSTRSCLGLIQNYISDKDIYEIEQGKIQPTKSRIIQDITKDAQFVGPLKFVQSKKNEEDILGKLYVGCNNLILEYNIKNNYKIRDVETILNHKYKLEEFYLVENFKIEDEYLIAKYRNKKLVFYDTESKRKLETEFENVENFDTLNYNSMLMLALKTANNLDIFYLSNIKDDNPDTKKYEKLFTIRDSYVNFLLKLTKIGRNFVIFSASANKLLAYEIPEEYIKSPNLENKVKMYEYSIPTKIALRKITDAQIIPKLY
jgi:hypothetical protein